MDKLTFVISASCFSKYDIIYNVEIVKEKHINVLIAQVYPRFPSKTPHEHGNEASHRDFWLPVHLKVMFA